MIQIILLVPWNFRRKLFFTRLLTLLLIFFVNIFKQATYYLLFVPYNLKKEDKTSPWQITSLKTPRRTEKLALKC